MTSQQAQVFLKLEAKREVAIDIISKANEFPDVIYYLAGGYEPVGNERKRAIFLFQVSTRTLTVTGAYECKKIVCCNY